jgi:hypothetical protein
MLKSISILLVAVVVLSLLAFALQPNQQQSAAKRVQPAEETCAFTFTSGAGHGLTQYCVTANGNIAQFSAIGGNGLPTEFLSTFGPAIEGYGLCDANPFTATAYFDYAQNDSGNWNPATAVLTSPNTVVITRTTADGAWKLVQTITQMKGSKKSYGAAKIAVAITNLSPAEKFILFNRHAHIEAGATQNDYDVTQTTSFGMVPGGSGLSSTASFVTTQFDFSIGFVMTVPDGPDPCKDFPIQGAQQAFFHGDGAAEQVFEFDILPGKTKTLMVTYKPI